MEEMKQPLEDPMVNFMPPPDYQDAPVIDSRVDMKAEPVA